MQDWNFIRHRILREGVSRRAILEGQSQSLGPTVELTVTMPPGGKLADLVRLLEDNIELLPTGLD